MISCRHLLLPLVLLSACGDKEACQTTVDVGPTCGPGTILVDNQCVPEDGTTGSGDDGGGDGGGGDDGGGDDGGTEPLPSTATVGTEGGSIGTEDGAQVDVPAGALADDVELSIEQGTTPESVGAAALPGGFDAIATVVVTPHGTTFSTPSTLSLPYSSDALGDDVNELVVLRADDLADTAWAPVGELELGSDNASLLIDGFSVYSLAAVAAGACPCWSGADMRGWKTTATDAGLTVRFSNWAGGTYDVKSCNYFEGTATRAKQTVGSQASGAMYCENWGNSTYGGAWPPTSTSLTRSQYDACWALLASSCIYNRDVVQLGVYATGLPSGESVVVTVTTTGSTTASTDLTIETADDLLWMSALYTAGTTYEVEVKTQSSGVACSVAMPTGTLSTDNMAVEISCEPPVPCPCWDDAELDSHGVVTWCLSDDTIPDGVDDYFSVSMTDGIGFTTATDNDGSGDKYCKTTSGSSMRGISDEEHDRCWTDLEVRAAAAGITCE